LHCSALFRHIFIVTKIRVKDFAMMHPEVERRQVPADVSKSRPSIGIDRRATIGSSDGTVGHDGPEMAAMPNVARLQQLSGILNASAHARNTTQLRKTLNTEQPKNFQPMPILRMQQKVVLQGVFIGNENFANLSMEGFANAFKNDLSGLNFREKRRIYDDLKNAAQGYRSDDIPLAIATLRHGGQDQAVQQPGPVSDVADREPDTPPEAFVQAIDLAVEQAQRDVQAEIGDGLRPRAQSSRDAQGGVLAPEGEARDGGEKKPADDNAGGIIINYVWLGNRPLGPLEKFNIYSWRALGHQVNIYTLRFDGAAANYDTLGIADEDAAVIDLHSLLEVDALEGQADHPKAKLGDARALLTAWIAAIPPDKAPTGEHIFNMVDLTKSYIGGTKRGIVLDMKVGPSQHLPAYIQSFNDRFISYSRGGKAGAGVENQSMGTMQESNVLRNTYADRINRRIVTGFKQFLERPNEKWFDLLTSFHGQAFLMGYKTDKKLDVATQTPEGGNIPRGQFEVSEPGDPGHGPFRVFKAANDQSNQNAGKTREGAAHDLAAQVWHTQLNSPDNLQNFVGKAEVAKNLIQ
jgi:hypothetical protein